MVLTEERRYFLFVKFVPENTKKTSHASYSKLFVNTNFAQKYACIFFLEHYLFLKVSFPRASLSENCSHLGTNNVHGQIFVHIYAPNRGHCLFILWQGSFEVNPGIPIGPYFPTLIVSTETCSLRSHEVVYSCSGKPKQIWSDYHI